MNRSRLIISLLLILLLGFSLKAEEKKDTEKSFNFGIFAGSTNYKNLDSAVHFGISASQKITDSLAFELRTGYMKMETDKKLGLIDEGDLKVIPLQLSLIYNFSLDKLSPYILVGAGYYIVSFENSSKNPFENLGMEIDDSFDNKFGFHIGGGIDYQISSTFSLNGDIRYTFADLAGTYKITDTASGISRSGDYKGKLDNFALSVGVKISL